MRKALGVALLVAGIVVLVLGLAGWNAVLGMPRGDQAPDVGRVVIPVIVGAWLVIGGVYALAARIE